MAVSVSQTSRRSVGTAGRAETKRKKDGAASPKTSKSRRWLWLAGASGVFWAVLLYAIHIPLPEDMAHREKMQAVEVFMRLTYYYPMTVMGWLGGHMYQLWWTRKALALHSWLIGPKFLPDPADILVSDTELDGVPVRVYVPQGPRNSDGATLFIHGGGFVVLDVPAYEIVTREMARLSRMVVVSIDYRLAPEHQFPAGIEDCERATRHFLRTGHREWGVDPEKVALVGDSAGGNLVSVIAQRLKRSPEEGLPALAAQVLIYPVLQFLDFQTPSYQLHGETLAGTALLDPESLARWLLLYLDIEPTAELVAAVLRNNHTSPEQKAALLERELLRHDELPAAWTEHSSYAVRPDLYGDAEVAAALGPYLFHPDFCPLCAEDLSGLPPALVLTAHYDILRDDGVWYAKRLEEAGVRTEWKHYHTAFHAFLNFHTELDVGRHAIHYVMDFVTTTLEGRPVLPPVPDIHH